MIKVKTFLIALFLVPFLCGPALCAEDTGAPAGDSGTSSASSSPSASSNSSDNSSGGTMRMTTPSAANLAQKMSSSASTSRMETKKDLTIKTEQYVPDALKADPNKDADDNKDSNSKLRNGAPKSHQGRKEPEIDETDLYAEVDDGATVEEDDETSTESSKGGGTGTDIAKKAIGAVSSAAMGIGAMQMAQGLSEQKSDKEAEADMRQYLNTFTCTYGAKAQTVKFGPEDVTLDAGADLVKYATEYRGLAERLKKTKKALNLTPGIEEEEIIDPATSGLYSYTPTEKKDGQYTSLSKAILNEESEDAKEWAAQKSKSKKRVIGGAVALGAGTLGSVFGDKVVDKVSEKIAENRETRDLLKSVGGKKGLSSLLNGTDGSEESIIDALKEKYGDKLNDEQISILASKASALFKKEKSSGNEETDDNAPEDEQ